MLRKDFHDVLGLEKDVFASIMRIVSSFLFVQVEMCWHQSLGLYLHFYVSRRRFVELSPGVIVRAGKWYCTVDGDDEVVEGKRYCYCQFQCESGGRRGMR